MSTDFSFYMCEIKPSNALIVLKFNPALKLAIDAKSVKQSKISFKTCTARGQ